MAATAVATAPSAPRVIAPKTTNSARRTAGSWVRAVGWLSGCSAPSRQVAAPYAAGKSTPLRRRASSPSVRARATAVNSQGRREGSEKNASATDRPWRESSWTREGRGPWGEVNSWMGEIGVEMGVKWGKWGKWEKGGKWGEINGVKTGEKTIHGG